MAPLIAERYLTAPGGKGANVARAAARLGADVALVGRIGDDEFGRQCVQSVSDDGVDTSGVLATADAPTGFVAIELVEGRHRSLLFAPGANDQLTWTDVEPALASLGAGDLIIAQAEVPNAVLAELRVLVKTGETGSLLADGSATIQVPTLTITPIDETGAGDVFLAALAVKRSEGTDWATSTRFANAASALLVATDGLMLPTRGDVDRAVRRLAVSEGG